MSGVQPTVQERHSLLVYNLTKPPEEIQKQLTTQRVDLLHALTGIETEVGEIATAIKEHVFYNKQLDVPNIIEELGDLEFYLERLRWILCLSREETLEHNLNKLNDRYKAGKFSDQAAIAREDKLKGE